MQELTHRQNKIYTFIADTISASGLPPTIREIALRFGYKSINNVRQHLRLIAQKGFLKLLAGKARGIELVDKSVASNLRQIPLVGAVAAGAPITAEENVSDYIAIDKNMFRGEGLFTLRIRGNSMIGIGVFDGDIVICRQQQSAQNGEVVVAIIDGEATLKRFIKDSAHIILHAENPQFEDIIIPPGRNLLIAGKMVGLLRKC